MHHVEGDECFGKEEGRGMQVGGGIESLSSVKPFLRKCPLKEDLIDGQG